LKLFLTLRVFTVKRLTCRKCEGHGFISVLKGHAAICPFNECSCERCSSVMSMRANALIRRFRHRQPGQNLAVLKTIRSKNGNMRLRIVPKGDQVDEGTTITYTDESSARAYVVSSSATLSSSASGSSSPSLPTSPPLLPTNVTTPLLPTFNQDILFEYLQQILQARLYSELLKQQSAPFDPRKSIDPISPLLANTLLSSVQQPLQYFSVV
ncbi:DM DNA binding domain protein, partial [Cooperia oncophora]